jgi:hypothetical protein
MFYRLVLVAFCAVAASLPALAQTGARPTSESKRTAAKAIPRTPDGHPDLQGVWTNATITPLERPAGLEGKATLSDAEAKVWEKKDLSSNTLDSDVDSGFNRATGGPGVGAYNNLFVDRGSELARVDGVKRTSLIIDPPDGKIPPLTDAASHRNAAMTRGFNRYDDVKDRPLSERCIIGFGSTSGPPMMPVLYNNNYEIVQTPQNVMILVEMVHDIRVIRINGTHKPSTIRQLLGDSIGHWEGDTLVVDTTNFSDETHFRGSSENLHVIERFTRVDANTILYKATIDDPATYTRQWTLEYPFLATAGPVYEYACHEGNYAMPDIMGGARKLEKQEGK